MHTIGRGVQHGNAPETHEKSSALHPFGGTDRAGFARIPANL